MLFCLQKTPQLDSLFVYWPHFHDFFRKRLILIYFQGVWVVWAMEEEWWEGMAADVSLIRRNLLIYNLQTVDMVADTEWGGTEWEDVSFALICSL